MTDQELLRRFFDAKQHPDLLRHVETLDGVETADALQRVVGAAMARERLQRLAGHGITVSPEWRCPCYLRDSRGHLHRRREKERGRPGLCYRLRGSRRLGGIFDHGRSWLRERKRVALTLEPYGAVDAPSFTAAAESLEVDELVVSACSCCSTHFPGMTSLIVISRAEDPVKVCP